MTPTIRFPDFQGQLSEHQLGDIATFRKGKGVSKADIVEDGHTPCVRYGELYTTYGQVIDKAVSKTNLPKAELLFSQANDVVIPASGETPLEIATAACVLRDGIGLGGDLNIIRGTANGVFLAYYLSNKKKLAIARLGQGVSVVHLYGSHLASLKLRIPSAPEQQKIADFLLALDERIKLLQRQKDTVERYKLGIIQRIFSQSISFKRDDGSAFPEWRRGKLADVFVERREPGAEGAALLSVSQSVGVVPFDERVRRNNSSADKTLYKSVLAGDIAYNSMRMWQGASGLATMSGIVSPAYTVLSPKSGHDGYFWASAFKTLEMLHLFTRYSQGLTSDTWTLKFPALSKIVANIPEPLEQQKIGDFLKVLDKKISAVAAQVDQMQAFKKGMLQQMFV